MRITPPPYLFQHHPAIPRLGKDSKGTNYGFLDCVTPSLTNSSSSEGQPVGHGGGAQWGPRSLDCQLSSPLSTPFNIAFITQPWVMVAATLLWCLSNWERDRFWLKEEHCKVPKSGVKAAKVMVKKNYQLSKGLQSMKAKISQAP